MGGPDVWSLVLLAFPGWQGLVFLLVWLDVPPHYGRWHLQRDILHTPCGSGDDDTRWHYSVWRARSDAFTNLCGLCEMSKKRVKAVDQKGGCWTMPAGPSSKAVPMRKFSAWTLRTVITFLWLSSEDWLPVVSESVGGDTRSLPKGQLSFRTFSSFSTLHLFTTPRISARTSLRRAAQ